MSPGLSADTFLLIILWCYKNTTLVIIVILQLGPTLAYIFSKKYADAGCLIIICPHHMFSTLFLDLGVTSFNRDSFRKRMSIVYTARMLICVHIQQFKKNKVEPSFAGCI